MNSKKYWIYSIISFALLAGITACSDTSTGVEEEQQAVIQGAIEQNDSPEKEGSAPAKQPVEGQAVWAASIQADGSFEKIADTETETDASGHFTISMDAPATGYVAVVADNGSHELKGFLSAGVENGQTYTIKPLNAESTGETEVFARVVADGAGDLVHKSDIEIVITAENGSEIVANSQAVSELAAAVKLAAEARSEFFAEFGVEDADMMLEQYGETMTEVQFDFESDLENSSSPEEKESAFEAYLETVVEVYTETGLDISSAAQLMHLQAELTQSSMNSVSSSIRNGVRSSTSLLAAIAIDHAVRAHAEASGMSGTTISAVADAGSALRTDIWASSGAEHAIEAAFETYHAEVTAAIENDSEAEGTMIVAIDTELNSAGGAKLAFDSAFSGLLQLQSFSDLYTQFSGSVKSSVEAQSDLIGEVDADAVAEILILINLF